MSRPDEGLIHQWLDGECTPEESARLEQLVAADPEWAAAVAEARGLIAASSRTVQSLDAVPRAMPRGSVAAPRTETARGSQRFAVKPWMALAAGLAFVVGSAYVLRDTATAPFLPVAAVDTPAPVLQDSDALSAEEVARVQAPATIPALQPRLQVEDRSAAAEKALPRTLLAQVQPSTAGSAEKILDSPNSISIVQGEGRAGAAAADANLQMRARALSETPRAAVWQHSVRAEDAPSTPELTTLEGCWRVSAPPERIGVLEGAAIVRTRGDTLVLRTARGDATVTRNDDELRGDLVATRVPCGAPY